MNHFISNIPFLIVLVGICPGGIWHGGYCPAGICPGVFVRGVFVLIPNKHTHTNQKAATDKHSGHNH